MGMPSINMTFRTAAAESIRRVGHGVVALIVRDSADTGNYTLEEEGQIPAGLGQNNQRYVKNAFIGYVNRPTKVLLCVVAPEAALTDALSFLATQDADFLAGPPDCSQEEAAQLGAWVSARRQEHMIYKAVLPGLAADKPEIINFTTAGIQTNGGSLDAAAYCSRIAGLLAGTPLTISATYAPLPEVEDVSRLTRSQMDEAVDKGQLILFHDGKKVKVARAVNSLVTTNQDMGPAFQKIKIAQAVDLMQRDLRLTMEDSYIGKYANSYDNKCLLISAIQGYFESMELEGVLARGKTQVELDLERQKNYLKSKGVDVSALSELELKQADTGDQVFLKASIVILDAIEEISVDILL